MARVVLVVALLAGLALASADVHVDKRFVDILSSLGAKGGVLNGVLSGGGKGGVLNGVLSGGSGGVVGGLLDAVVSLVQSLLGNVDLSDEEAVERALDTRPLNQVCQACPELEETAQQAACVNYCVKKGWNFD